MTAEELLELIDKLKQKGADPEEMDFWKNLIPAMTSEEIAELGKNLQVLAKI